MKTKRSSNEVLALLAGLIAAFFAPTFAVQFAGDSRYSGAVILTTGLKNLGLGDMERGIGVCGLIGLVAALIVSVVVYLILSWLRGRR